MRACFIKIYFMARASIRMGMEVMKGIFIRAKFVRAGRYGKTWFIKEGWLITRLKGMALWNIRMAQNTWGNFKII